MFEPFRCEDCVHGKYYHRDGEYYCKYEYDMKIEQEQCEQYYEDDEENIEYVY